MADVTTKPNEIETEEVERRPAVWLGDDAPVSKEALLQDAIDASERFQMFVDKVMAESSTTNGFARLFRKTSA